MSKEETAETSQHRNLVVDREGTSGSEGKQKHFREWKLLDTEEAEEQYRAIKRAAKKIIAEAKSECSYKWCRD